QQKADFVVPKSDGSNIGSPASGLTNQQNWNQYGIAIAGAVAPSSATTMTGIAGLVQTMSSSHSQPASPQPIRAALSSIAAADVISSSPSVASAAKAGSTSTPDTGTILPAGGTAPGSTGKPLDLATTPPVLVPIGGPVGVALVPPSDST